MKVSCIRSALSVLCALCLLFVGCSDDHSVDVETQTPPTTLTTPSNPIKAETISVEASWDDDDRMTAADEAVAVTLSDSGSTASGDGVQINGTVITFTAGGHYRLSGSLSDGQLRVESTDNDTVQLILDGVNVHCERSAPLFVKKAEKVVLTLSDGTVNTFSDSASLAFEDAVEEEPSATVFSKSDLTVNGSGVLTVDASFRDGIVSRDGLKIADGAITVNAVDDAVMGRDYVLIGGGNLTLHADGDGIKSTNDASEEVGFVVVENGNIDIVSGSDGIQSTSSLTVSDGSIRVVSGGGSVAGTASNSRDDFGWGGYYETTETTSVGKGLKAGTVLTVCGGVMDMDAADDALHANRGVVVSGGEVLAAAGDDGVHADEELLISGGTLTVSACYEGLEAGLITLDGGTVSVTASDDGVNASSGTTSNRDPMASDGSSFVINGGTLYVNAGGDGLDSNGTIQMNGGYVSVVGPLGSGNGTFDFASSFRIDGGTLIAVGTTGMAQTPSVSRQNSVVWGGFYAENGDRFVVADQSGKEIAGITATHAVNWAYFCSPELTTGETYTLSCGDTSEMLTVETGSHTIGNAGGMGGGFPGDMGGGRPGGMGGGRPW